jgi:acyl-CoA synthetase (AMP-forming)/AMP-acid ligase II
VNAVGVPEAVAAIEAQLLAPGSHFALVETQIDGQPIEMFANRVTNLRDLVVNSCGFGDAEYLLTTDGDSERRVSFAEHERLVASVAAAMAERYDVRKGDRVAILGANSIDWIVSFWAATSLGAIACALNGWWTGPEIGYATGYVEPKLLIADRKRHERVRSVDLGVPVVVMEEGFADLTAHDPAAALPDATIDEHDPAIILFTSGTTGRPKGAVHTHGNVGSLLAMLFFQGARAAMSAPPATGGAPSAACQFMTSPLFHVSGLHTGAVMFLATGIRSVWWTGRFDAPAVASVLERERCTGWSVTETVLHRFVHHPDIAAGKYDLSAVRTVGGGGSAVPPATQELARQVFPNAARSMGFGYGLTECTALATTNFGAELLAYPTSCGRPLPTVTIEVRSPDEPLGAPLPEGVEGEVWIRSPMVMSGYWRLPEATAEAVHPGGWLRTGDWGRLEGGRLFLASRRTDLILRGGENVYPAEIEARLVEHPAVDEVVVVGVPDAEFGQAVKAVIVPRRDESHRGEADPEDLRAFCAAALAYYKVPTVWEFRSTPIPRNAMGKVLRDVLDDRAGTSRRFVEE